MTQLVYLALLLPFLAQCESIQDYFDPIGSCPWEVSEGPPPLDDSLFCGPPLFDFHNLIQNFVSETKRIIIPGFSHAFNPSLIQWKGKILMTFRTYSDNGSTHEIGIVPLDEQGNLAGPAQLLSSTCADSYCHSKRQDPRLITLNDKLYIVYNNHLKTIVDREIRRMLIAEVLYDGVSFSIQKSDIFLNFEGESAMRTQKNWVPFEYGGTLLFAYSLTPHRIFRPLFGTESCELFAESSSSAQWDWGVLRGGTPAIKIGDEYLAFFHSSKNLPSVHSNAKTILHYFMGAYTFSAEPPFELTRMSPEPIVGPHFYDGPAYKTWKPLRVVFPMGIILVGDSIWISYGKQDHETWIVKIDKTKLLESLIPIRPK